MSNQIVPYTATIKLNLPDLGLFEIEPQEEDRLHVTAPQGLTRGIHVYPFDGYWEKVGSRWFVDTPGFQTYNRPDSKKDRDEILTAIHNAIVELMDSNPDIGKILAVAAWERKVKRYQRDIMHLHEMSEQNQRALANLQRELEELMANRPDLD